MKRGKYETQTHREFHVAFTVRQINVNVQWYSAAPSVLVVRQIYSP